MSEIDVSEIFQKLRTKNDIINFFREQSKQLLSLLINLIYSIILS